VAAVHAADLVHVATAALNAIAAHTVIEAHAGILAHVERAAHLVAQEKAKTGDKIPHRIVPTSLYRLTRRSYLTATLAGSSVPSFPEFNETTTISLLTRTQALAHLKLLPSRTPPTVLSDEQLASILRKPQLGHNDRANHNMVCAQLQKVLDQSDRIGIEMYHGAGQPTTWMNVMGEPIPPDQHDEILYKYQLPTERDRSMLGNYWWIVRIRPTSTNKRYCWELIVISLAFNPV
jgi:hypothetical protein